MRLTEILKPENIRVPLDATNKSEAIGELVALLAANNEVNDAKEVLGSVLEREATRTTGIGNGLAIPHGKCTGTDHLVMAIGRPNSSDRLPVHRRPSGQPDLAADQPPR